jgi:amino acid adenylation domain-containing protein
MQDEAAMSFRLSPQQELLWSAQPDGPVGGPIVTVDLDGNLDVDRLRQALSQMVGRHEILRTTFPRRSGMHVPLQVVQESLSPDFDIVDLRALEPAKRAASLAELEAAVRTQAWDYEAGPLVRARIGLLEDDRQILLLTVAAPCADAGSLATAAVELAAHYGSRPGADDPLQYADFAEWQHQLLEGDDDEADAGRRFWTEVGLGPAHSLPFVHAATPTAPETIEVALDESDRAAIAAAAAQSGISPDAVVQAAWHLVALTLGGGEISLATVPAGRIHDELDAAIGVFARALPVRVGSGEGASFADVAAQLHRTQELAERWQDYAPPEVTAGFTAGFVAHVPFTPIDADGVRFSCRSLEAASSFPITLEWDGACRLRFDPAAVDRDTAERVAGYLRHTLTTASAAPNTAIDDIELLDDEAVRRLTVELNATFEQVDFTAIHEQIAFHASTEPDHSAAVDENGAVTYAELDARANQLAHRLARAGVGHGSVVGLCTDRSVEMIVGLLGILKAGGAYLPLNFEHPAARLGHQLQETGAPAVVTQEAFLDRLPEFGGEVVCLDRDRAQLDAEPDSAPEVSVEPDSLVYVIYTSGSTGTPKGVAVTHANVANYVHSVGGQLGATERPLSFGMVTAISTDLGNTAVFPALCTGGTLVLVSPAAASDAAAAANFLRTNPIDVLKITPSHLSALLTGGDAAGVLPSSWLVIGGEALSWDLVGRVRELGSCRILNHYGPTETTIGACTSVVADEPGTYSPATAPIGRPIANTSCYVLDERGRCVPEWTLGELHIGGAGVARGYIGQPELTAERFHTDPFSDDSGARTYATGDLVRRLPDGELEFVGRRDDQLKIRGFRVEPSEVEAVLRKYPPIRETVVVGHDDGRGERRLVAYVVADSSVTADDLKRHAAQWLPDVMIPSAFVTIESLPLTPSGKVDRLALPAPDQKNGRSEDTFVAPRTPVEETVAAIWINVLGVERVGVNDDFFALGGHSLLATQIIAQIRSDLSVNLPLHSLFTAPTVATLAAQVVEMMGDDEETAKLLAEVDDLSDDEVERLLAGEPGTAGEPS